MKTLLFILLLCLPCHAAKVPLEWDAPPEAVKTYVVTEKNADGTFTPLASVLAPAVAVTLTGIPGGVHTFAVYAVSAEGLVSDNSNELTVTLPGAPKNLRVKVAALDHWKLYFTRQAA
jgi:hypothetical protein